MMPCPAEHILGLSPTYALEHCVPVTARLSKRFYDVLGEDVANAGDVGSAGASGVLAPCRAGGDQQRLTARLTA